VPKRLSLHDGNLKIVVRLAAPERQRRNLFSYNWVQMKVTRVSPVRGQPQPGGFLKHEDSFICVSCMVFGKYIVVILAVLKRAVS